MKIIHFISAGIFLLSANINAQVAPPVDPLAENPGNDGDGSFTVGPDSPKAPDLTDRGNPKGTQFQFTMKLADSKIFHGDDTTLEPAKKEVRKERKIFVYIPAAYKDGTSAPLRQ